MNQINFKDMDTTVINDAKRIISQMNTGNECDYMEAGYLYYGMGLYGYFNDVIKSGCEYTRGKNRNILPHVSIDVRWGFLPTYHLMTPRQ